MPQTVPIPGPSFSFKATVKPIDMAGVHKTTGTGIMNFEKVKHLLSNKPLRVKRPMPPNTSLQ